MCGIVGYIGAKPVVPILIQGLQKLEYRGYDSAGVAVCSDEGLQVVKKKGKIEVLEKTLEENAPQGTVGIGHTRWATHGRPSDVNAHPHTDCTGRIAVVHNGIVENYISLKENLQAKGHKFTSETDTEVLAHLLESHYEGDLLAALRKALKEVDGSYAMVAVCNDEPGRIVAARKDSPMIIGLGEGEYFVASDIPAVLAYTRDIYIINDGEIIELTLDGVTVTDIEGNPVEKQVTKVKWDAVAAEKGGYRHFMLKEIFEQPKALRDTMNSRLTPENDIVLKEINITAEKAKNLRKIFIVACGTAFHAGVVGKYVFEELARLPVEVDIASEFRYRNPILGSDDLVIVISQSGETADTLAALREAKRQGASVIAVTNVVGSSVARDADNVLYTWAGPEIAVASTKAYTTQLLAMLLLGIHFARLRGAIEPDYASELIADMRLLPEKAQKVLEHADDIARLAQHYAKSANAFFLGRSLDYAVAMEGSLKLKEISYMHAEAYAAGELKHGTLALIVEGVPVIALATQENVFEKTVSNIKEVKARDATVLSVAMEGNEEIEKVVDHTIFIPRTDRLMAPVLTVIPLQLLAYHVAVARGCDVDQPRNLAKSVTVE